MGHWLKFPITSIFWDWRCPLQSKLLLAEHRNQIDSDGEGYFFQVLSIFLWLLVLHFFQVFVRLFLCFSFLISRIFPCSTGTFKTSPIFIVSNITHIIIIPQTIFLVSAFSTEILSYIYNSLLIWPQGIPRDSKLSLFKIENIYFSFKFALVFPVLAIVLINNTVIQSIKLIVILDSSPSHPKKTKIC